METGWEYMTLVNELTEGLELTKQLKFHMNSNSSIKTRELLLERILSSYDKALLVLKCNGSVAQLQPVSPTITGVPDSSLSVDGSPRSEEFEKGYKENLDHRDVSKKRKVLQTWTDQVRVCSETGLEGPIDDGYSWRKYGQKDILGAKYPRSYYRCTYRNMQSCSATKQVQRTDSDPTIFEITYRGTHTCSSHASNKAPAPTSPEKQEAKETNHHNIHHQQSPNELLMNFRTNLRVNTEDFDSKEKDSPFTFPSTSFKSENPNFPISTLAGDTFLGSFSQSIISPATPESNYFTDILSANTSATNSPIVDLDFSIEHVNLDPDFPLDILGFFN